jgi:hypothetical protein
MATVVKRTFRSSPYRNAVKTWEEIVDLLTRGQSGDKKRELLAISGVAASLIADQCPNDAAIVVTCDGPRTRIYTTYNEDAMDGTGENEDPLGFDPLVGDWAISLPCEAEDLHWVSNALKKHSSRITARDRGDNKVEVDRSANSQPLTLDPKGFLGI